MILHLYQGNNGGYLTQNQFNPLLHLCRKQNLSGISEKTLSICIEYMILLKACTKFMKHYIRDSREKIVVNDHFSVLRHMFFSGIPFSNLSGSLICLGTKELFFLSLLYANVLHILLNDKCSQILIAYKQKEKKARPLRGC